MLPIHRSGYPENHSSSLYGWTFSRFAIHASQTGITEFQEIIHCLRSCTSLRLTNSWTLRTCFKTYAYIMRQRTLQRHPVLLDKTQAVIPYDFYTLKRFANVTNMQLRQIMFYTLSKGCIWRTLLSCTLWHKVCSKWQSASRHKAVLRNVFVWILTGHTVHRYSQRLHYVLPFWDIEHEYFFYSPTYNGSSVVCCMLWSVRCFNWQAPVAW